MALGTTGRLGALLFAAALGAGIAVRRKQDRFVYSDQGIEDEDILQALEFVNARKTQKVFFLLPKWLHKILRGRLQKLLDITALFFGTLKLLREGQWHVIKHVLFPKENGTLHVSYDTSKAASKVDFFHPTQKRSEQLLVFVHGGAWGSGHKFLYRLFGLNLANLLGVTVANVGYGTYPKQRAEQQIADVATAVEFLHSEAGRFQVDPSQIHLMGHSSGAHLVVMALLQRPSIRQKVHSVIPVSGVYDLVQHRRYECARGVENISTLEPACGGFEGSYDLLSPMRLLEGDEFKASLDQPLPPFFLIHGLRDGTVPSKCSTLFREALLEYDIPVTFEKLEHENHASIIMDIIQLDPTEEPLQKTSDMPVLAAHVARVLEGRLG